MLLDILIYDKNNSIHIGLNLYQDIYKKLSYSGVGFYGYGTNQSIIN